MSKKLKILFFFLYIFIFSVLLRNSFSYMDPDFGWHLKMGEYISETNQVPWEENYNYTLEGQKWVDHEWLLNYLSFKIFDGSGYIVLNLVFAIVGLAIIVVLNAFLLKKCKGDYFGFFLLLIFEILGFLGVMAHIGVRMQVFTILMFLFLVIILEQYSNKKEKRVLFFLPLLFLLWANLHAGFFLGIFIVWFWFFYMVLGYRLKTVFRKWNFRIKEFSKKEIYSFFFFALASSLVTLLTPYHINYFLFILKYSNTVYLSHVLEWLPIWYAPINYYQLLYEVIFVTLFFVVVLEKKIRKIDLWYLLLSAFLLLITFKARRNFPLFFIASMPLMFLFVRNVMIGSSRKKIEIFQNNFVVIFLCACLLVPSVLFFLGTNFTNQPFQNEKFCKHYPCRQIEKIKELPKKSWKVFNNYSWGGFLIWEWTENKLFIDGRLPMLPKKDQTLLEEYYEFQEDGRSEEKLNEYGIDLVIFGKEKERRYNWFEKNFLGLKDVPLKKLNLEKFLEGSSEWQLLYQDKIGYVYYR